MKRMNILITITFAALFVACSKPSLQDRAKERANAMLEEAFSDSEVSSFKILNEKFEFSGDSLCILHFDVNAQSVYQESSVLPMEYVIGWTFSNPVLYEAIYPIKRGEKPKPIKAIVKDITKSDLPKDKKECERMLRIYASPQLVISGRKVKDINNTNP